LLVSAVLMLVIGMRLGLELVDHVKPTLRRTSVPGSLEGDPDQLADLINERADRHARTWGVIIAAVILAAYTWVYVARGTFEREFVLVLLAAGGGYLAGRVIGRMLAVSSMGRIIECDDRWAIHPQVASLDGAAGLAPVGVLYLRQASVLFIPAAFLATWWAVMPLLVSLGHYERWNDWRTPYLALLPVALALEVIGFLGPMLSFHRQMKQFRDSHLVAVDAEVSKRLAEIEPRLGSTHDPDERRALKDEIAVLKERYATATQLPTWPIDRRVRRRFSVNNAVLLVPLVGKLLGLSGFWADLAGVIGKIFGEG
ncbi:MAG: hypothetical protein WCF04_03225, partial [Candidatus Nanopelagicales bacterium]